MINRQAMRGAGTKTTTKTRARTKLTKETGARTSVKASGKAEVTARPGGRTRATSSPTPSASRSTQATRRSARRPTAPSAVARRDSQRKGGGKGASWHGEEVSSPASLASSAEAAASRAEGNGPVRAEVAVRDPDPGTFTERGPARRPRANDPDAAENAEEKRQSAAEAHGAQSSRHPPYGRL